MRRRALKLYEKKRAAKRAPGEALLALDELSDLLPGGEEPARELERGALKDFFDGYLAACSDRKRYIFLARWCYSYPVAEIAQKLHVSLSTVQKEISAIKKDLKEKLAKEDLSL